MSNLKIVGNEEEPKLSELLATLIDQVKEDVPTDMDLEDLYNFAGIAWNFANMGEEMSAAFEHPFSAEIMKMAAYKKEHYPDHSIMIGEVFIKDNGDILVETQSPEAYWKEMAMIAMRDFEPGPADSEAFEIVNRNALMVVPKKPFYAWLNKLNPDHPIKEHEVKEHTVYLIRELESDLDFEHWLKRHFSTLFESELYEWHTDERNWPQNRTLNLFKKWFRLQWNSMVVDFEEEPLYKE